MLKQKLDIINKEINRRSPNWNIITKTIESISDSINNSIDDFGESISTLAYTIEFFCGTSKSLIKIIELFLEYGFDPKQNNYKNGYSVLNVLPWTTGDCYMIDAAKILLNAGAKIDQETYDTITWQEGDWTVGDPNYAMIITTFGFVAERAKNNLEYQDIQCWNYVKGKRLNKIEKFYVDNEKCKHCENYVLWFEKIPLIVNEYCECYVNPYLIRDVTEYIDVSDSYKHIIGERLHNINYTDANTVHLRFRKDNKLVFHFPQKLGVINVLPQEEEIKIKIGTEITCIKFRNGITYEESVRVYSKHSAYICTGDSVYQVTYPNFRHTADSNLTIIKVNKSFIEGFDESINLTDGKIKNYYLYENSNRIFAICIECLEGYLYIGIEGHPGLSIFMSSKHLTKEELLDIQMHESNSKIELLKIDAFKVMT